MTGFQDKAQTLVFALKAVYNLVSNDSAASSTSLSLPYQVLCFNYNGLLHTSQVYQNLRVLVQSIFAPSRCPINLKPCNYCLIVTPLALKLSSLTIFKGAILVSLLLPLLLLLWLCPSYSSQKYLLSPCCMSGMVTGTRNIAVNNQTRSLYLQVIPQSSVFSPFLSLSPCSWFPFSLSSISSYLLSISACKYSNHQVWPLIPYIFFSHLLKQFQSLLHWRPLLYEFLLITTSPPILEPAYLGHFSNCSFCLYSKLPVFLFYPFLLPKSLLYKLVSALPLKQWEGKRFEENEVYFLQGIGTIPPASFRDISQTI